MTLEEAQAEIASLRACNEALIARERFLRQELNALRAKTPSTDGITCDKMEAVWRKHWGTDPSSDPMR